MLPFCGLPVMFVHCAQTAEDSDMISFAYDSPMSLPDHVKTWLTLVNPFLPKFMETFDGKLWPNGYRLCNGQNGEPIGNSASFSTLILLVGSLDL